MVLVPNDQGSGEVVLARPTEYAVSPLRVGATVRQHEREFEVTSTMWAVDPQDSGFAIQVVRCRPRTRA